MGLAGFLGRSTMLAGKIGLFVGTVQLSSELGVWGRDPNLAKNRILKFFHLNQNTQIQ